MKSLYFERINCDDFYISNINNTSLFYGEADFNGICKIIKKYKTNQMNMLDVGSGCGKIVISCCLNLDLYVDGIEIDENRYKKSELLLEKYNYYDKINFIHDNFSNLYFGNYDIIYCCNLIFEDNDNDILYKKIIKEFSGLFILFQFNNLLLPYFVKEEYINCSWSKNVVVYIFFK